MQDQRAIAKIEKLTADEYRAAFIVLREQMSESDLDMLKAHFKSPKHIITATELAVKVGFSTFGAANLRYGLLANKFLEFFQIQLTEYVKINVLVYLDNP